MNRKRRFFDEFWNIGFNDFFRAFNEEFKPFYKENEGEYSEEGPITFGYSMKIGPDTDYQPEIRQWGNLNDYRKKRGLPEVELPFFKQSAPQLTSESRNSDRFVDIIDDEESLKVIVEVPGFTKENLTIEIDEDGKQITLNGECENRKIDQTITLPSKIETKQIKSSIHNGVLEIVAKKLKKAEKKHKVKIE
jgi:HSP20 family protein